MDQHLANYLIGYYAHFMTDKGKRAFRHLSTTYKLNHGRTDSAAQHEASNAPQPFRRALSENPEILELAHDGMESLVLRTAERIWTDHKDEIYVNRCPRCGQVAKDSKSKAVPLLQA
jgi:hypothetical protein